MYYERKPFSRRRSFSTATLESSFSFYLTQHVRATDSIDPPSNLPYDARTAVVRLFRWTRRWRLLRSAGMSGTLRKMRFFRLECNTFCQ
ncbi:hypothetical protein Q1695_010674 [Nippostrongylus brasiliensis]|nr:hypothetical protein Q1695_010674 [Nippostrongylus brasiliensis]